MTIKRAAAARGSPVRLGTAAVLVTVCLAAAAAGVSRSGQEVDRRLQRPQAGSERRLALIVGNDAYPEARLQNARNDARAIDRALRQLQFTTTLIEDVSRARLAEALEDFTASLTASDVVVFYYAGHGVQVGGQNYLLPVDFKGRSETSVRFGAVSANDVQRMLERARVSMLVLDACRNNPFTGSRAAGGGLAPMETRGSLVAFATGAGQTASDNPAATNGLFTRELLAALDEPGLSVFQVFQRVRQRVYMASNGTQMPAVYDSLLGDFVFRPAAASPGAPRMSPTEVELALWRSAESAGTIPAFEAYLQGFPDGQFATAARLHLDRLRKATAPSSSSAPERIPDSTPASPTRPLSPPPASRAPDVIYVPTPASVVDAMLRLANVSSNDVVYDLGCGDGRIVIEAAKRYGARGVGVDIDATRVKEARDAVAAAGVSKLVTILYADLFEIDLKDATVVALYLLPSLNQKLRPRLWTQLRSGARVVSHAFDMGEAWPPDQHVNVEGRTAYLWRITPELKRRDVKP
jgi:uncharacterized caspase-like protein